MFEGRVLAVEKVTSRLRQSIVPGAAIAVLRAGDLSWAAGYGLRNVEGRDPVDFSTVFSAASVSKAITALAILGLAEQGLLDLDADVRPLLAYPLDPHPGLVGVGEAARPVTPRLLLEHRGGVIGRGTTPRRDATGYLGPGVGGGSCRFLQPLADPDELRTASTWFGSGGRHAVQLTSIPGSIYSYSGAGYLVLQHLVEQVTGNHFATHMDGVLAEFGAANATFNLRPAVDGNFAAGHTSDGRPLPGGHELVPWSAAGGLFSDVISLAAVLGAVLRGDQGFPGYKYRKDFAHGLGTRQVLRDSGEPGFSHGGDNSGYRAVWTGFPTSGDGVVVLTNGRGTDGTDLRSDLARWAMDNDVS